MNSHFQIYNEDCLEGMKKIPDGSVDLVLTDPPFGTLEQNWDKALPTPILWEQLLRLTKTNAAILLFSQMPFGAEMIMSNRKMFRYVWIVEKNKATGFLNARKMPMRCHEQILVFYRSLPTYNPQWTFGGKKYTNLSQGSCGKGYGWRRCREKHIQYTSDGRRYPRDVLKFNFPHGEHITQKPVDLLEYLIRTYTNEGETVLDATCGSGSTGVACMNTGRKFIGFEIEKKFFDIAEKRITEALALKQQELFSA